MEELFLEAMKSLVTSGPIGIVLAFMLWRDVRRDKRTDFITDAHFSISRENNEVLSALKETIREALRK